MKEVKMIELDDKVFDYDSENKETLTKELLDKLTNIEKRLDETERIIEVIESPMLSKEEISEKIKEFKEKGII